MSKILKKTLRLLLAGAVVVYCYCLIKGIEPIDYRASENGGIVSVAGNEIELAGEEFREAAEVYGKAESRASELIPDAVRDFYKKVKGFFGFADEEQDNAPPADRSEDNSVNQEAETYSSSTEDNTPNS